VKDILSRFCARLEGICAANKNVFLVPTQGTLQPGQWANELHPTRDGFHAIAQKFLATLRTVQQFEGRI
jgi:phospholipase/lecithinase/hemolysin